MFPGKWVGDEPLAEIKSHFPRKVPPEEGTPESRKRRKELIRENAEAERKVSKNNAVARPKLQRYGIVAGEIVVEAEAGRLATAIRLREGGAMMSVRPEWWNTERWAGRFFYGELDPGRPFDTDPPHSRGCPIFVQRSDLDRLVLAHLLRHFPDLGERPAMAADLHLSPYLKVMLAVVRRANVTPENQPNKLSLEAEINAIWPGDSPLSARLRSAMATLIREPESQQGRNQPRRRDAHKGSGATRKAVVK
jgi:hypothetical protein